MNRRDFLRTAGLAIAALGIDPEQLIWQPKQMIVVPNHIRRYVRIARNVPYIEPIEITTFNDGYKRFAPISFGSLTELFLLEAPLIEPLNVGDFVRLDGKGRVVKGTYQNSIIGAYVGEG